MARIVSSAAINPEKPWQLRNEIKGHDGGMGVSEIAGGGIILVVFLGSFYVISSDYYYSLFGTSDISTQILMHA